MAIDPDMMITEPVLYGYKARVRSIYDADTLRLDIDLGCNVWINDEPCRLYGIDAWEIRGEERELGLEARDYLRALVPVGSEVFVRTYRDQKGKYGRWLVSIWYQGVNLNKLLVLHGYAQEVDYG